MPESGSGGSSPREDPRYAQGMAHLQAGDWPKAIRAFEELIQSYSDSPELRRGLEEARFKARLDQTTRVRGRRVIIPWRAIIVRVLAVAAFLAVVVLGARLSSERVAPLVAQLQDEQRRTQLAKDVRALIEAEQYDQAQETLARLSALAPNSPDTAGLAEEISQGRERLTLYRQGVGAQEAGDLTGALRVFTDLSVRWATYRDVNARINEIRKQLDIEGLFQDAEADNKAGRCESALNRYAQLQTLSASYRRDYVAGQVSGCLMRLGRALIERNPPQPDLVQEALEYFNRALALRPNDAEAAVEQRLASRYLAGQADYEAGRWSEAALRLETVYTERPGYLGSSVASLLYQAYLKNGDSQRDNADCGVAWDQYRKAAQLPVPDKVLAQARMESVRACLTPTPTPTATATVTPYVPPTPAPSATPPAPLATYRGLIIFLSDKPDQPGFWVMNPDGSNRRYLGPDNRQLRQQYDALVQRESFSPDGRYRAYVAAGRVAPQIWIAVPDDPIGGKLPPRELTKLTGLSYDPAWAPDGGRIAFVSAEDGSDDIWIINADGSKPENLTRNTWEWDKHPSWSADSTRIVFWSNREGTKQIYTMDPNGQSLKKLSFTQWDEYDPLWVK